MNPSASSRSSWLLASIKLLFVLATVLGAFFSGMGLARWRAQPAVRDAEEAAETARHRRDQVRLQLEIARGNGPPPPPPVTDQDGNVLP